MAYFITVVTPPASEPIDRDELKNHLKLSLSDTSEDDLLDAYISAARLQFEENTDGHVLISTTFKQYGTCWEDVRRLQVGPVSAVSSVKYIDPDGDEITMDTDDYEVDTTGVPALVVPHFVPALHYYKLKPISVQFVAGYANAAAVPQVIKVALMELAGHMYRYREAYDPESLNEVQCGFNRVCRMFNTGLGGF